MKRKSIILILISTILLLGIYAVNATNDITNNLTANNDLKMKNLV